MLVAALLVNAESISFQDDATSKKRVLENLSHLLAAKTDVLSAEKIFQVLLDRERLGSTGLGRGVAIPHARVPGLTRTIAAMLLLKQPVEFEAADGEPVDLAFGLLVPEDDSEKHLQNLSRLVSIFRDDNMCSKLRVAENAEEVFDLLLAIDDD